MIHHIFVDTQFDYSNHFYLFIKLNSEFRLNLSFTKKKKVLRLSSKLELLRVLILELYEIYRIFFRLEILDCLV